MKRTLLIFPVIFLCALLGNAQQAKVSTVKQGFLIEKNSAQWPTNVSYMADVFGGRIFFENNRFTFSLHSLTDLDKAHEDAHHNSTSMQRATIRGHAYRMNFVGANPSPLIEGNDQQTSYRNYFIGNDESKWASNVPLYTGITYQSLYDGIDLHAYGDGNNLKYDYIVYPGADANQVRVTYEGVDKVELKNGKLVLTTSLGEVIEQAPVAWQIINGIKKIVKCEFVLRTGKEIAQTEITFNFPNGYDANEMLLIDPVLVASTYSGATSTNYGHCATYDAQGNIYTGAISFSQGYPVTTGAFQAVFGGNTDIAISKLNPTGSALLYATYIGGAESDYPHSMIVNGAGELFVYGSTASSNFPVTAGAFDQSFNSPPAMWSMDIIVSHLNATGTVMIGSTYVGGSGNDGSNAINYNYGDTYRGEIILDGAGNPYIGSFSESANFPVTAGSYDNTANGMQDAVIFKMNPALTTMTWSTFLGGSDNDGCFGIDLSASGEIYAVGATASSNFPAMAGTYQGAYQGGMYDGFVVLLLGNGSLIGSSTFFGTPGQDLVYFIDVDAADNVYIYGQSDNAIPVTAGVYSNPGSPQFISKLDPALLFLQMSTVFGDGNTMNSISPTAFMVDVCDHIYAAGWGAVAGYTVTPGAIQPTTDGNDFYLIVLDPNATALMYATWFGANGGWEHVDGGTSRFDPNGIVYEAICQGASNMTTTPTAYSPTNQVGSYDVAVFKIDFQAVGVMAVATASTDTVCVNQPAAFTNGSVNATDFIWDFGDGSPLDTNANPTHVYVTPGNYTVTLIAIDSLSCNIADTFYLPITVLPQPVVFLGNDTTICGPVNLPLNATTANCTYLWSTGATTATITATAAGTYWVEVDNGQCSASDTINITSFSLPNIGSDTTVCDGTVVTLDAGNPGSTYNWSTGAVTQTINVTTDGIYWVDVSSGNCTFRDSIDLTVIIVPQPNLGNDTAICPGNTVTFTMTAPAVSYLWSDGSSDMTFTTDTSGTIWVTATVGACTASDTVNVSFLSDVYLGSDVSLCDISTGAVLDAGNPGSTYLWSTGATTQTITVSEPGRYWVNVVNTSNCLITDTIDVAGDIAGTALYIPNCFTPNGDGKNEYFCAESSSIVEFHMQIFNRWGQLIFESSDITNCWDGKYKGARVQEDVYVVKTSYTSVCSNKKMHRITHVAVLPKSD